MGATLRRIGACAFEQHDDLGIQRSAIFFRPQLDHMFQFRGKPQPHVRPLGIHAAPFAQFGTTVVPTMLNHGGPLAVNTTVVQKCAMSRVDPQLKLRLPASLKARIEESARLNNRSINAEILMALVASYPHPQPGVETPALSKVLHSLRQNTTDLIAIMETLKKHGIAPP